MWRVMSDEKVPSSVMSCAPQVVNMRWMWPSVCVKLQVMICECQVLLMLKCTSDHLGVPICMCQIESDGLCVMKCYVMRFVAKSLGTSFHTSLFVSDTTIWNFPVAKNYFAHLHSYVNAKKGPYYCPLCAQPKQPAFYNVFCSSD